MWPFRQEPHREPPVAGVDDDATAPPFAVPPPSPPPWPQVFLFFFDTNETIPTRRVGEPATSEVLENIARQLRRHPLIKAEIVGRCDPRGGDDYNRRLGLSRAEQIAQYLVGRHGISPARISVRSTGERDAERSRPLPNLYWLYREVVVILRP